MPPHLFTGNVPIIGQKKEGIQSQAVLVLTQIGDRVDVVRHGNGPALDMLNSMMEALRRMQAQAAAQRIPPESKDAD